MYKNNIIRTSNSDDLIVLNIDGESSAFKQINIRDGKNAGLVQSFPETKTSNHDNRNHENL